jgi:hypothetical protein
MYLLAEAVPIVKRLRIPVDRDQAVLLLAAFNEVVLGIDTYLAHSITGTLRWGEWIPIIFGGVAGLVLLLAGLIALRCRSFANLLASLVFLASIVVGILGSYYHLRRGLLPDAPFGQQLTMGLLVFGPPLFGPITFALVGWLGLSAAWAEDPVDSGRLRLLGSKTIQMPLSKTRAYFFLTALFTLATVLSSILDHARTNFENPWLWLPTFVGVFAVVVTTAMGAYARLERGDLLTYIGAMILMGVVGLTGAVLHVQFNLTGQGTFLGERFIHGAPVLAPLLYANMAALGLMVLLDPQPQTGPPKSPHSAA